METLPPPGGRALNWRHRHRERDASVPPLHRRGKGHYRWSLRAPTGAYASVRRQPLTAGPGRHNAFTLDYAFDRVGVVGTTIDRALRGRRTDRRRDD